MNHSELNTNGTDYVSDAEFDALISELQSITEEARATDYHDTLRKAALFLNLLRAKVLRYANDIVRLDAACTEQHDAYVSACNRVDEINDLDFAKAQVRSAGYSLVSAEFIIKFAEFIQDWRKGDFDLPRLAAFDVEACFDAWQKEVNQNEVKPVLQTLERVPMTESGWLIECNIASGAPFWLKPDGDGTNDSNEALRFSRATDAQGFLDSFLVAKYGKDTMGIFKRHYSKEKYSVTEHEWIEAHHNITPPESKG